MDPLQQRQALRAVHLSTITDLELVVHAGECSGFMVPECWWEIATRKLGGMEPTKIRQMANDPEMGAKLRWWNTIH